jgi:hypothetical protein
MVRPNLATKRSKVAASAINRIKTSRHPPPELATASARRVFARSARNLHADFEPKNERDLRDAESDASHGRKQRYGTGAPSGEHHLSKKRLHPELRD